MIELRHLNYFLVLADELHFGRAAEKLFISQPPLSRQIKQFEQELGVQLFERNNKKVELTRYGTFLKKEGEKLFADILQIEKNLQLMKTNDQGKITIGYVGAVMFSFFPKVFNKLKSKFPNIHFILKELSNTEQIDALNKNLIDIGFVRGPLKLEGIESRKVESSTFSIVISETHPLTKKVKLSLSDLKNEAFIRFSKSCAPPMHNSLMKIFNNHGFEPLTVHETTQMNALLRLVESGFGFSIVPTSIKEGYDLGLLYYELKNEKEITEISMIYNPRLLSHQGINIIKSISNMNNIK